MTIQECVIGLKYLGTIFNKEFTANDCKIYYSILKKYKYETFSKAVKNLALTKKYMPVVSEIVEECDRVYKNYLLKVLDYMQQLKYFKSATELDKTYYWLNRDTMPYWLLEDMRAYYRDMQKDVIDVEESEMKLLK